MTGHTKVECVLGVNGYFTKIVLGWAYRFRDLVCTGAMGALAPAILRKNCYFNYFIKKLLEVWKNYINAQHPQYQNPNEVTEIYKASRFINGVGLYFGLYARLRTSKEMDGTHYPILFFEITT